MIIRHILLTAIAFGFFTSPVHAAPQKQEPSSGMSKQDELQIMKRACQMSRDNYTSAEILSQISYLIQINRPKPKLLSTGQVRRTFVDDQVDGFNSLIEEANAITNKQITVSLIEKAIARNCRF